MSDKANKIKPRVERLARMEGVSSFRDPRELAGGGWIDLSDQDCMAALAFMRAKRRELKSEDDIAPECLETHYGSNQRHRQALVRWYMRTWAPKKEPAAKLIARRMATTLAAQVIAGVKLDRDAWEEFAFIVDVERSALEALAHEALNVFYAMVSEATGRFNEVLSDVKSARAERREERWKEMREADDRKDRIAGKVTSLRHAIGVSHASNED